MDAQPIDGLLARLARLERQARRWRRATLAAGGLLGLGMLLGAAAFLGVPRREAGGAGRITLVADEVQARRLTLLDSRGDGRADLSVDPDGAARLRFADRGGAIRAVLGMSADGSAVLGLNDRRGNAPRHPGCVAWQVVEAASPGARREEARDGGRGRRGPAAPRALRATGEGRLQGAVRRGERGDGWAPAAPPA